MTAAPAWGLAAAAGALCVLGFAPFAVPAVPLLALGLLFVLWSDATPRAAAQCGFAFGAGLFGAGASWIYVALTAFGDMPPWLGVISIAGFCAYLSLWPALAGWIVARATAPRSVARMVACAGAWTAAEWLRGYVFTGFNWLSVGYAQVPDGWLAGYAPLGGMFVVSLAVALVSACLARAIGALAGAGGALHGLGGPALGAALVVAGGVGLARVEWTRPDGAPLAVSLVQGNVLQEEKFDPEQRERTFGLYTGLVAQSRGQLVVLPESAFPMFASRVPDEVLADLVERIRARDGLLLLGVFTADPPLPGSREPRYYNTVAALGGADDIPLYRKRHLVPFGESIPLKTLIGPLINDILAIPLSDQTPGEADQPPFVVAGRRIAVNICYEDAFGGELIGAARAAGILVNVTNDAWYGHSIGAWQHNQIAAMRALELGRPMLRATNTGVTSAIDASGREFGRLPWFTRGVLEVEVVPRAGRTPFVAVGELPALLLSIALVAAAALARRRAVPRVAPA